MHAKTCAAIAAVAALLLFAATPVKAGIVEFRVYEPLSFMSVGFEIDLSEVFGNPKGTLANIFAAVPQAAGADTAGLFGDLYVDLGTGTSIEFLGFGTITVKSTGAYAPFDPVVSDPPFPTVGVTSPANYGLATGSPLFLAQVYHQMTGTLVSFAGAMPLAGTSFVMVPGNNMYLGTGGRIAFSSALLGSDTSSLVDFPLSALGTVTGGVGEGTWDPSDFTTGPSGTLTIPLKSAFEVALDTGDIVPGTHVYVTFSASGQIVASWIPEPSSMLLLGFAVVGLLTCGGRRLRTRRI